MGLWTRFWGWINGDLPSDEATARFLGWLRRDPYEPEVWDVEDQTLPYRPENRVEDDWYQQMAQPFRPVNQVKHEWGNRPRQKFRPLLTEQCYRDRPVNGARVRTPWECE